MTPATRSSLPLRVLKAAGVGVVIVLALVAILTALRTELPRSPGVMSDAVGPDAGEPVGEYLARVAAAPSTGPDAPRWALVSAARAWAVADADRVGRDLPRVAGLIVQVPVDGVAMPVTEVVLAEPTTGEDSREPVFGRGLGRAADGLEAQAAASAGGDRGAETSALTAARIRAGEPAIIGMIVRGTDAQLRAVAAEPGVRAVEALPADAVRGRFAVRPLLPQQTDSASPLPDLGPVPAR